MDKDNLKSQLVILTIILAIVIGVAIFVNIALSNKEKSTNTTNNIVTNLNGNQTNVQDIKINGYTKEQIENMKPLLNAEAYQKYMETFNAIENGSIPYQDNFKLDIKNQKNVTDNNTTVDNTTSSINEANQDGSYSFLNINGEQTNIKVYNNIEGD